MAGQRVVVVSGSAGGQGRAVVAAFQQAGDTVVALDIVGQPSLVGGCVPYQLDVSNPDAVREFGRWLSDHYGRCDLLYNNAGICMANTGDGPLHETSEEAWTMTIAVNLKGPLYLARAVLPLMIGAGMGVIINVASTRAVVGGEGLNAYAASKGGVLSFTKSLALSYASHGIRAVCISPGILDTGMTEWITQDAATKARYVDAIPQRRLGSPADIAALAVFLASDSAAYLNGCNIVVDGGLTIW